VLVLVLVLALACRLPATLNKQCRLRSSSFFSVCVETSIALPERRGFECPSSLPPSLPPWLDGFSGGDVGRGTVAMVILGGLGLGLVVRFATPLARQEVLRFVGMAA
jgi:hypothetical protein